MEPGYNSMDYVVCNHSQDTIGIAVMARQNKDKNDKLLCYQKIESDVILPSDSSRFHISYNGGGRGLCSQFFSYGNIDTLYFIIFKNDIDVLEDKKSALPIGPNVLRVDKYYECYIDLDVRYLKIVYP